MKQRILGMSTKKLVYTAVLVAINIALNSVDINVVAFGAKMTFSYIPCFIAGIFLGPLAGLLTGLVGDVLGIIIHPQGVWMPLITVSSALLGLIPGLVFKFIKLNPYIKIAISFALVFLVCTVFLNTYALFLIYSKGRTFWVYLGVRMTTQPIVFAINAAAICLLYMPLKRYVFKSSLRII